jgi:Zn finger protein HypA/HybF involved in hydrogenase expression
MLNPRLSPPPADDDPFDVMIGRCGSCKAVVECRRCDATPPPTARQLDRLGGSRGTGGFSMPNGCWSVECPACRAKTARVTGTDGNTVQGTAGPMVYLTRKAR